MERSLVLFMLLASSVCSQENPESNLDEGPPTSVSLFHSAMLSSITERTIATSDAGPNTFQSLVSATSVAHVSTSIPAQANTASATQAWQSVDQITNVYTIDTHDTTLSSNVMQATAIVNASTSEAGGTDVASVIQSSPPIVVQSSDAAINLVPTSVLSASGMRTTSVLQSPIILQSQATNHSTSQPMAVQTSYDTKSPLTSLVPESIDRDTPSAIQRDPLVPSQAKTTQGMLTSVADSALSIHLAATGSVARTVSYSMSRSTSDILQSQTSIVPTLLPSLVGTVTSVTSKPTQQSTSGLAGHGLSSQLLTESTLVTSLSQTMIHPTSMRLLPTAQSSWHLSSSAMLPVPTTSPPGEPDPPVILNITVLSAYSVILTWKTKSAQSGANFSVEFSNDSITWQNSKCNQSLVLDACVVTKTEATVTWLKPYTNYTFRVATQTLFGKSNYSREIRWILTDEAAPSDAPTITAAYNESPEAIFIAWSPPPPETLNGKLRKYELRLTEIAIQPTNLPSSVSSVSGMTPSSSSLLSTPVLSPPEPATEGNGRRQGQAGLSVVRDVGKALSFSVGGLKKWTHYEVEVRAVTVAPGPFSKKVSVRTDEDVPSQPSQLLARAVNSTAVFVNWTEPEEINGVLLKYEVTYSEQGSSKSVARDVGKADSVVISSLNAFSVYTISVGAFTSKGRGNQSTVVVQTDEGQPSPPQNLSIQTENSTAILVAWQQPANTNGKIKYWLSVSTASGQISSFKLVYDGNNTHYVVSDLKPFTSYNFQVIAYNVKYNLSSSSVVAMGTTTSAKPSDSPLVVEALTQNSTSILIKWKPPNELDRNGVITHYIITYNMSLIREVNITTSDNSTQKIVSQLRKYSLYYFTVRAVNTIGVGPPSNPVFNVTAEDIPGKPVIENNTTVTNSSIEITWKPPADPNGIIKTFELCWGDAKHVHNRTCTVLNGAKRSHKISNLKAFSQYAIELAAITSVGRGLSDNRNYSTKEGVPSQPQDLRAWNTSGYSIKVTWKKPANVNGRLKGYKVFYRQESRNEPFLAKDVGLNTSTIVRGLAPYMRYFVKVQAFTGAGGGHVACVNVMTDETVPPPLGTLKPPDEATVQSNSFRIQLAKASNEKGIVSYYQVIVIELATDNKGKAVPARPPDEYKDLYTYDQARSKKPNLVPYIAAEFNAKEFDKYKFFTVGDSSRTSRAKDVTSRRKRRKVNRHYEFFNGPLEEETFYAVFQRAFVNEDTYTSSPWIDPVKTASALLPTQKPKESTSIALIVGLVLVIIIVCILVLVGIYYVRRRRTNFDRVLDDRNDYSNGEPMKMKKLSRKRRSMQKRLMGSTESLDGLEDLAASRARRQPVPIDDFERHVDRMHMDGDHGFSEEYALVQPDEDFSFQQFLNPANKYKNRYANIVAYDHTRVLLNPIEGIAGSDYINANFIDGYNRQRAYVAAQGPLMETFDDFWRMIWEQMSSVIVMLTKLEERGRRKCDQYWPERGMKTYGSIQVTLKETLNMSHYTVRKFVISHKLYPGVDRVIKQFHFMAWPDHGVPSHPTPLLSLVRNTYTANRESVGPMVVHCSAGVGRTGTFITLDVMLQRITLEDCVDIFSFVRKMRYQRNFMVQTEAQYVFIHDALLEAITCGVTEVEAKDLGSRIRELRQLDAETGYTYLENEFCRLAKEENHPIAFKSASLNCNASKNRYANILPFESTRVHLKMRPGEMGSDYINANFIDGYCQPRAYIATQAPVPDTFDDFWRMIWEQECASIVMLTREEESGKVKCHHYWPSEGSCLYGGILVELAEEDSYGDYTARRFKMTHTEFKESRTVTQFQYSDWPDTGLPDSGVGIVDLIGQVQKWQQQSGNTIIVIHCSGGVGRTGVFCGISMMIERLKAEGVIDVFQTVQAMRLQRPAMVQTAEQYEFCYTTLQEYLDSFDLYANFQ